MLCQEHIPIVDYAIGCIDAVRHLIEIVGVAITLWVPTNTNAEIFDLPYS